MNFNQITSIKVKVKCDNASSYHIVTSHWDGQSMNKLFVPPKMNHQFRRWQPRPVANNKIMFSIDCHPILPGCSTGIYNNIGGKHTHNNKWLSPNVLNVGKWLLIPTYTMISNYTGPHCHLCPRYRQQNYAPCTTNTAESSANLSEWQHSDTFLLSGFHYIFSQTINPHISLTYKNTSKWWISPWLKFPIHFGELTSKNTTNNNLICCRDSFPLGFLLGPKRPRLAECFMF